MVLLESILDIAYRKMPNVSILKFTQDGMMTQDYYNVVSDSDLDAGQKLIIWRWVAKIK